MKDWELEFEIIHETTLLELADGKTFEKRSYFVVRKATGEKIFPAKRPYGYSSRMDACRGAAHIYRNHLKIMEETLLG